VLLGVAACARDAVSIIPPTAEPGSTPLIATTPQVQPRADRWQAILLEMPVSYARPLPQSVRGPFDGIFAKLEDSPPQYWRCYRCADYRPVGGIWRLQFERGVMRVYYDVTGWVSIGSYTVEDNRIQLFNDPFCPNEVGEYEWRLESGALSLTAVEDSCAWGLRGENLGHQPWLSCEAAGTTPAAAGCRDLSQDANRPPPSASPDLHVNVYGGDSRFFERPPEVVAIANTADRPPPDGIRIRYADESVAYGLQRILWWGGDWIEAQTDLPFASMGVQILGEAQIGWARLLFDEVEVWRGDTAAIWQEHGRHGGYVELTGFQPGAHVLRLESLDFDYRPVTAASFGFSLQGTVRTQAQ
jgi:hypothetical protein